MTWDQAGRGPQVVSSCRVRPLRLAAGCGPLLTVGSLLILIGGIRLAGAAETLDFNEHIKPILSDRCFMCHGPDPNHRRADLRLDRRDDALKPTSDGPGTHILVPGDAAASAMLLRITSTDESLRMPPPDSKLSLTADEITLIRRWIEAGAPWTEHWAFRPLVRPALPAVSPTSHGWEQNEIDRFVAFRLAEHELTPAPPATRDVLIRRLSFDLRGLPPSLDEIDAFLADDRADAYERLVDQFLKSTAYGERMATEWLDVARYADTYGYQVDRDRFVWPWRDWVVRAYNANLPFDQFVTEQIAGDLLPTPTTDQRLATTFCRLHPQKVEGGSIPEEFRVEYVADRNQTFATAFLGLAMECARCHDHKYDPLTQRDYYQLSAFFNNIDEAGLYSYFTDAVPSPSTLLTDDATAAKLQQAADAVTRAEAQIRDRAVTARVAFQQWRQSVQRPVVAPDGEASSVEAPATIPGRMVLLSFEDFVDGANIKAPGHAGAGVKLSGDDGVPLEVGNFDRCEPFSVALWLNTPDLKERAVIFHRSRAWTDAASRGYELLIEEGKLSAALVHFWPGNALRVVTTEPLSLGAWNHVVMTYDGSSRASGLALYVNGTRAPVDVVRDNLFKNITGGGGDNITIGERFRDHGFTNGLVDEFAVYRRQLTPLECRQLYDGTTLTTRLAAAQSSSADGAGDSEPDEADLYAYYLSAVDAPYQAALQALRDQRAAYNAIADAIPEIMTMREMETRRTTYVLRRGAYDNRGDEVGPDTPGFLPPFPADQPRNRLGLARWLTDPRHPLTARVAVNRYWQVIFGNGLVRTPEDFGSQGRPPTHPLLLDWLAVDFIENGWDVKRLVKQMVMSAAYRQSAQATAEKLRVDPENLWLSYGPTYRLPAEMLRDNALAVSGLLVDHVGGPPVRPYELAQSYDPSEPDAGDGVYRRSLYTYWKGSGPAPVMMTLDASKRDVCRMRRERTASPLQALVLLNGPQFVEASRALSTRLLSQPPTDEANLLRDLFRRLTSREPSAEQLVVVQTLYRQQLDEFQQHPDARDAYLAVGRLQVDPALNRDQVAALSVVANTLFNFDACVTKR